MSSSTTALDVLILSLSRLETLHTSAVLSSKQMIFSQTLRRSGGFYKSWAILNMYRLSIPHSGHITKIDGLGRYRGREILFRHVTDWR